MQSWKRITCLTANSFVPSRLWWVIVSLAASWRLHLQWWCWSRVPPCWAAFVKSTSDWQYLWHGCRRETQSAGCPVHPADHLCNCPRLCGRWLWSVRDYYCLMLFFVWCLCKSSIRKGREKMSCIRMNTKDITNFYFYASLLNVYHYYSVPLVKKTKSIRCEWFTVNLFADEMLEIHVASSINLYHRVLSYRGVEKCGFYCIWCL